jgi:hypothetical protein
LDEPFPERRFRRINSSKPYPVIPIGWTNNTSLLYFSFFFFFSIQFNSGDHHNVYQGRREIGMMEKIE